MLKTKSIIILRKISACFEIDWKIPNISSRLTIWNSLLKANKNQNIKIIPSFAQPTPQTHTQHSTVHKSPIHHIHFFPADWLVRLEEPATLREQIQLQTRFQQRRRRQPRLPAHTHDCLSYFAPRFRKVCFSSFLLSFAPITHILRVDSWRSRIKQQQKQ